MSYFVAFFLGVYSALVTLIFLKYRKNKLVSGVEGFIEVIKWFSWVALWLIPPIIVIDKYAPPKGRLMLIVLWIIPTAIVMFVKGREAWKRGEWEHQLRKKEAQKKSI